jgi:hypothetical protein
MRILQGQVLTRGWTVGFLESDGTDNLKEIQEDAQMACRKELSPRKNHTTSHKPLFFIYVLLLSDTVIETGLFIVRGDGPSIHPSHKHFPLTPTETVQTTTILSTHR